MYVIDNELYHHGVLGMRWGVRRYQSYAENPKLSDRKKKRNLKRLTKKLTKEYKKDFDSSRPLSVSKEFKETASSLIDNYVTQEQKKKIIEAYKREASAWDRINKVESEIQSSAREEAYRQTYDYFKKNYPEYLNEIEKDAKQSGSNLRDTYHHYNDFDTMMDGMLDEVYPSVEEKYFKKHPDFQNAEEEYMKVFRDYYRSGKDIMDEILGDKGNKKIKEIYGGNSLNELVGHELRSHVIKKYNESK